MPEKIHKVHFKISKSHKPTEQFACLNVKKKLGRIRDLNRGP